MSKNLIYNQPMNGSQIAKELGISRQAVSFALRKAVVKMYKEVLRQGYADSPFDAIYTLMTMLGLNDGNITDIQEFVDLFPKDIQNAFKSDAICTFNIKSYR